MEAGWIYMLSHYLSAVTQAIITGAPGEDDEINASALTGPKKCPEALCAKLTIDYMKLEIDLHECAEYPFNNTLLLNLRHQLIKILPETILSFSPKKISASKATSAALSRQSSNSSSTMTPTDAQSDQKGKRPATQQAYGILIGLMPKATEPENIRSFL